MPKSTTEWISIITTVATFLTALAALATILEMRRQRESTYKPILAIIPLPFYLYWTRTSASISTLIWSAEKLDLSEADSSTTQSSNLRLECSNIGFGAATNIEGEWKYDIRAFINAFQFTDTNIEFEFFGETSDYLKIESKELDPTSQVHSLLAQRTLAIPYMMPESVRDEPFYISMPSAFMELCRIYFYDVFKAMSNPRSDNQWVTNNPLSSHDLPSLRLTLRYLDIGGKHYTQNYEITITPSALIAHRDGALEPNVIGRFDIVTIQ